MTSDYYIQDNADVEAQKFESAKKLYQAGDFNGALRLYLDMLNTNFSYKLYYEIGRCYYKLNDIVNSELFFIRSVEIENIKNPSYRFLGTIAQKKNDIKSAIEYWTKSFAYSPDDESVCLNLATSYFSKNMIFYSTYYYRKYLKYAKNKNTESYISIKNSIDNLEQSGNEFYKKGLAALSMNDKMTAIQSLEYAVKNNPLSFDFNYLLGKIYFEIGEYNKSSEFLEQALAIDSKSADALSLLITVDSKKGEFPYVYCLLKRMLPLVIGKQKEYLDIVKTLKELEIRFDGFDTELHLNKAETYYSNNDYKKALFEYENYTILNGENSGEISKRIDVLKTFINPEDRIIKACFEKGVYSYSAGDFKQSNRYFTKIMTLSGIGTPEYKMAKAKIVDV